MSEHDSTYATEVERCSAAAITLARRNAAAGHTPNLFLWHKPSHGVVAGQLIVAATCPGEGWLGDAGDPLRPNLPYTQYRAWIDQRARQLPILAAPASANSRPHRPAKETP